MELECEFKGQCGDEAKLDLCERCGHNKRNQRPSHWKPYGVKPVFSEPRKGQKGL